RRSSPPRSVPPRPRPATTSRMFPSGTRALRPGSSDFRSSAQGWGSPPSSWASSRRSPPADAPSASSPSPRPRSRRSSPSVHSSPSASPSPDRSARRSTWNAAGAAPSRLDDDDRPGDDGETEDDIAQQRPIEAVVDVTGQERTDRQERQHPRRRDHRLRRDLTAEGEHDE